jgi:hypothetical protein
MAANHGTRGRYMGGCRCDECRCAQADYQQIWRQRKATDVSPDPNGSPGPVESAVEAEVGALARERPTLVAIATAMARILDSSRVPSTKPPAAKVLVSVLDTLHKGSAQGRRGSLALVRTMTGGTTSD